jgi:gas vesicle protein
MLLSGAVAVAILLVGGCGKSHESVMKDMVGKNKDLLNVLEGVKDESSAKAAQAKIADIGKEMMSLIKDAMDLGQPSPEAMAKLEQSIGAEAKDIEKKLRAQAERISADPKLKAILGDLEANIRMGMK